VEFDVSAPRIEPRRSTAVLGVGRISTAEIRLSGLPRGAALVLYGPGGLDTHAPEVMNLLAEHGYEPLAADLGALPAEDEDRLATVVGLLAILGERGWSYEQVGVVGFGAGGRAALVAARDLVVGAVVSLSPRDALQVTSPLVRSAWLGLFGEHDRDMTFRAVAELETRLRPAPQFSHLVVYPGVGAEFFQPSSTSLGHAAAFDSGQRILEWLNIHVVPRPSPYAQRWADRLQRSPAH
jgi:carboxymethylenebutenolidase